MSADTRPARDLRGDRLLEIIAVVLLGLATLGTAWCGYEAARWNGEEGDLSQKSSDLRVEAARLFGLATQAVTLDANLVAQYAQAVVDGDTDLQTFYRDTLFRADFLPILDRWEAQIEAGDGAPPRLLEDQEYLDEQLAPYAETTAEAERFAAEAREAGKTGDDYVLVTVILATALFFVGVTASFRFRTARLALLIGASLLIAFAVSRIADLPVE